MRSLYSISLYAALGSHAVSALSYTIDPGCGTTINPILTEVTKMASTANDKLGKKDENMAAALKQIFQTTDGGFITNGFNTIKGLSLTSDHNQADIRIYCDNDDWDSTAGGTSKRWQLVPDVKLSKKDKKKGVKVNSEKPFADQQYRDPINQLYRTPGSKGCQDLDSDGEMNTLAQTYRVIKGAEIESTQNPNRATITICKKAMDEKTKVLSDIGLDKDLTNDDAMMIDLEDLVSLTIFHELCHLTQTFSCPGGNEPHGWDDVMNLTADKTKGTADAYAFLGLTAILIDRNARLSTNGKAKSGKLEWITPPTKPSRKRGSPLWFSA